MQYPNNSLFFPVSPAFSINRLSPYLSPLVDHQPRKSSFNQDSLLNFHLEKQQSYQENVVYTEEIFRQKDMSQIPVQINEEQVIIQKKSTVNVEKSNMPIDLKIQMIVQFLVENSSKAEQVLLQQSVDLIDGNPDLYQAFVILMRKFKKLKKTKQQMTKYCMRKAFKYVSEHTKKDRRDHQSRDIDICMKNYFSKQSNGSFSIPFKKNSTQKTMNTNFLRKVFSARGFVEDYRTFLRNLRFYKENFKELIDEDNNKKIKYLSDIVTRYINSKAIKKIQSIKRLPWTRDILRKTEQLSINLIQYSEPQQLEQHSAQVKKQ